MTHRQVGGGLWQIGYLIRFRDRVARQDLVRRFGTALFNATRDFLMCLELAPLHLDYGQSERACRQTGLFRSLFSYARENTL